MAASRMLRKPISDRTLCTLFLVPSLVILAVMVAYPFLSLLINSTYRFSALRSNVEPVFVWLDNYDFLLSDPDLWDRFTFTGTFVVLTVSVQFILAISVAYYLQRDFRGRDLLFTVLMIPMMLSPIVIGFLWRYIFNSEWGLMNFFVTRLGFDAIDWLGVTDNALIAVVIADTWMWTPFVILLAVAAFRGIPVSIQEAATIDGASPFFRFTRLTLPMSAPILGIAFLLRLIDSFKQYDLFFALTGGAPGSTTETVSFYLAKVAFSYFYTGEASALAVIQLVIIIGLSLIFVRLLTRIGRQRQ
ncbi:MAG: sugar ABC transporter permease [Rhodospirillaceae bacterium]|nr:sugar ABC transporter permease [Rhodospirillaceae bacterium]